jgi:hypothetical protein
MDNPQTSTESDPSVDSPLSFRSEPSSRNFTDPKYHMYVRQPWYFTEPDVRQHWFFIEPDVRQQWFFIEPDVPQQRGFIEPDVRRQWGFTEPEVHQQILNTCSGAENTGVSTPHIIDDEMK